jgi:hypothetical protein
MDTSTGDISKSSAGTARPAKLTGSNIPGRRAGRCIPTIARHQQTRAIDIVDEWGRQSFPASDSPSNW